VLELQICCEHATFGVKTGDCDDLTRAYISNMIPHSTGAALRGWRRHYAGAYIAELDGHPAFNSDDFSRACATVRDSLLVHPKTTTTLTVVPERKEAMRDPGYSPQINVDQFRPMLRILFEMC
jgi:hypothetical protein